MFFSIAYINWKNALHPAAFTLVNMSNDNESGPRLCAVVVLGEANTGLIVSLWPVIIVWNSEGEC